MNEELDLGLADSKLQIVDMEKQVTALRFAFSRLKKSVTDAFAPIDAGIVKALSAAAHWASRLAQNIGFVIAGVTGWRAGQEKLTKSVTKTYKALKRELAGFDEINRLGSPKGGAYTTQVEIAPKSYEIPAELQGIVNSILAALQPLKEFDLTNLRWHFYRMKEAVEALLVPLKSGFSWVWHQLLVPFAQWVVEQFVPTVFHLLESAARMLRLVLTPLGEGFGQLLEAMKPVFSFVGETLLRGFDQLRRTFVEVANTFRDKSETIREIFDNLQQTVSHIWSVLGPKLETLRLDLSANFSAIRQDVLAVISRMIDAFAGFSEFLLGAFTGNWEKAWNGLKKFLKNSINGILGLLNSMLSGLAGGINAVVKLINKLKFTLPDWIPGLGGKTFGLNLPTVKAPQIPYLAKGAVLPANKPFLAVVGDQKHGTNVEAPLATIQEAVGNVFSDFLPAMVAGFEAILQENVALRRTVEGISVGDETLARAVNRYNQKMEILRGV